MNAAVAHEIVWMIFLLTFVVPSIAATWYVFGMATVVGVLFACPLFFVVFAATLIMVADLMHRHMEPDAPAGWRRWQHLRQWRIHAAEMGYRDNSPLKPSTEEWAD